jgi:hypothetical protein
VGLIGLAADHGLAADAGLPADTPNYQGRLFGPSDPVPGSVLGHYFQQDDLVWAEFSGGRVRTGRLVGVRDQAGVIDAAYCQIMADGAVVAGRCLSTPTVLPDGRIRLAEQWHRADGSTGVSYIEELPPAATDVPDAGSRIGHNGAS